MSKIAVVTGGAGGIGQAVAERFARDEYKLVLIDLDDQAGQQLAGAWRRRGVELSFFRSRPDRRSRGQCDLRKNHHRARPHRRPGQRRRRQPAPPPARRLSPGALASCHRRQPHLDVSLLPRSDRADEKAKIAAPSSTSHQTSPSAATPDAPPTPPPKPAFSV